MVATELPQGTRAFLVSGENVTGFVYLISDGEFRKIGKATNVKSRLGSLQTGNPRLLKVERLITCRSSSEAHLVESFLHGECWRNRVRGEWFKIALDHFDGIARAVLSAKFEVQEWVILADKKDRNWGDTPQAKGFFALEERPRVCWDDISDIETGERAYAVDAQVKDFGVRVLSIKKVPFGGGLSVSVLVADDHKSPRPVKEIEDKIMGLHGIEYMHVDIEFTGGDDPRASSGDGPHISFFQGQRVSEWHLANLHMPEHAPLWERIIKTQRPHA